MRNRILGLLAMISMACIPVTAHSWEFEHPFLLRLQNTVALGLVKRDMDSVCTQTVYAGMCRHEYELLEKEFMFVELILSIAAMMPDLEERNRLTKKAYRHHNDAWLAYSDVGKKYGSTLFTAVRP